MGKSWELTDDQKKEIEQRSREIAAQYDPETGKKEILQTMPIILGMTRNSVQGKERELVKLMMTM